jgi:alkylation response protein AidB-like acyl-CoA dehydrogenase
VNLDETREEAAFRSEVRAWAAEHITPELRNSEDFDQRLEGDRRMAAAGYLGYSWPERFGGQGGTPTFAAILDEERALVGLDAARSPSRFGINLLGPTLMAHGTPEQQVEFLTPILRAEITWCQGFSEPDAGSDLANVKCAGRIDGDRLLVTGTKVWTTQADRADWCFALVVTDPNAPRHKNLSMVLIDMRQPGIEIQPLIQMTGAAEFNQVFFDSAVVKRAHVIGEIGAGWRVAMTTLSAERTFAQLSRYRQYVLELDRIAELIRDFDDDAPPGWLTEFGHVRADISGIRNLSYKIASIATAGEELGTLSSITKVWWTATHKRLVDLGFAVASETGQDLDYWYPRWLEARGETIMAGSTQIQKNIISERLLGLPR